MPLLATSSVGLAVLPGGPLLSSMMLYPDCMERYTGGVVDRIDFQDVRFSNLERAANDAGMRAELNGKGVTIIGKFVAGNDPEQFGLVRYRMNCCAPTPCPSTPS